MARSVALDRDFDLKSNYEEEALTGWVYPGPLAPHAFQGGPEWPPYHSPGLGLLLALPFGYAGLDGARLALLTGQSSLPLALVRLDARASHVRHLRAAALDRRSRLSVPLAYGSLPGLSRSAGSRDSRGRHAGVRRVVGAPLAAGRGAVDRSPGRSSVSCRGCNRDSWRRGCCSWWPAPRWSSVRRDRRAAACSSACSRPSRGARAGLVQPGALRRRLRTAALERAHPIARARGHDLPRAAPRSIAGDVRSAAPLAARARRGCSVCAGPADRRRVVRPAVSRDDRAAVDADGALRRGWSGGTLRAGPRRFCGLSRSVTSSRPEALRAVRWFRVALVAVAGRADGACRSLVDRRPVCLPAQSRRAVSRATACRPPSSSTCCRRSIPGTSPATGATRRTSSPSRRDPARRHGHRLGAHAYDSVE